MCLLICTFQAQLLNVDSDAAELEGVQIRGPIPYRLRHEPYFLSSHTGI